MDLSKIARLDDLLQQQLVEEANLKYEEECRQAESKSIFKIGDIVRAVVSCKEQACLISKVICCHNMDGGGVYTQYEVTVRDGRVFTIYHVAGHPDDWENNAVTIISKK
ncbi:MAG: hypothetical protein GY799_33170 [Desulfobulbaceae bacterium]|nr:hypothetical protein [Desulfobulbaceae bacterium]